MAYYSSNYEDTCSGFGEYHQTPYANYSAYPQDSRSYLGYEPGFHNLFDYNPPTPTPCYHAYDPYPSWSTIAYSTFTPTEPKSISYDPNFHSGGYDRPVTQVISYSVSEFNLPDFEEYDPTPYGGGYDIAQTYGKPLPPSEKTCYPRSTPHINGPSFNGVTEGSIIPVGGQEKIDEQAVEPHEESIPSQGNEEEEGKTNHQAEQKEETSGDHQPLPDRGSTHENGLNEGDYSHEYGKQGSQYPSGSGLEAMDLCESIFGYWPCLTRYAKEANACPPVADEGDYGNHWKGAAADYLFGSSYPYGERRDIGGNNYGEPVYGYERYYQGQPLHMQVEYEEDSLMHNFKIF